MDAITTYIDHMFRGLPRNAEVLRARGELEQMSLDRFHELRAEGVSENEAVGRVIAQFGNLEEIADDLGISIKTVEAHRANIMEKLGANTVADLLKIALAPTAKA